MNNMNRKHPIRQQPQHLILSYLNTESLLLRLRWLKKIDFLEFIINCIGCSGMTT